MNNNTKKIEVLAPCGSYEILVAAIHAGADACYIGGNSFGARAYAENFDQETIQKAVSYAHLHGVKVYLTVNTLVKQSEFSSLYDYILPFYEAGGDALIIQDLGVFYYVHRQFPDIAIHCSTQMNITSWHGAMLMKQQGASRIVTAREMSLAEIHAIKEHVDIEVETFVHGAMCYSYSGQCLMSSLAGGRSGNRGRCAQPCRKCYDGNYLLSMKDMCTLTEIPKLMEAGIDSLKIEGRMKNQYYVASAVSAYRQMVEDYTHGCFDVEKAKVLEQKLAGVYNRGGFSKGYFFQKNGADMISISRPNNQGIWIGNLKKTENGSVHIKLREPLYRQDVLELTTNNGMPVEITASKDGNPPDTLILKCPKTKQLRAGQKVYRTKCPQLLQEIEAQCITAYEKMPVSIRLAARIGEPLLAKAVLRIHDSSYEAELYGDIVEKSNSQPLVYETVKKPFAQLGNTEYELSDFQLDADTDAFLPAGLMKKLRRTLLEKLETQIVSGFRRTAPEKIEDLCTYSQTGTTERLIVSVSTMEQLEAVLTVEAGSSISIDIITVPISLYPSCAKIPGLKSRLYAELPAILHTDAAVLWKYLQDYAIRGIYIRNIDGLALVQTWELPEQCEILCDAALYCYNRTAHAFVRRIVKHPVTFMTPRELNSHELNDLAEEALCLTVYEYQPVMLTANCVQKTRNACSHSNAVIPIHDEMKHSFFAACQCDECCNIIYNHAPYSILEQYRDARFDLLKKGGCMLRFTIEDTTQVQRVLRAFADPGQSIGEKTTGHLYRGVL